jgi:L-lactate dehydrogenase complex protein LldG
VGTLPQALGLKESLRRKGVQVVEWADTPGLASQFDTDAGITDVHAALAETGTLVCSTDAGHSRGLSLVPPVHVAIVRRSDIVPDMLDLWARSRGIAAAELPSSIALITGPSKTADIEGELVVGVHGPGEVHVILVEDA